MSIYEYPAILKYEDDCFYVKFPDISNCFTDGDTREEAIEMACDVLPLMLCDYEDRHLDIPKPSKLESIPTAPNEEVVLIKANTTLYRKRLDGVTVKKNCKIPAWLSEQAERAGIDFSLVLQNALMEQLNLNKRT